MAVAAKHVEQALQYTKEHEWIHTSATPARVGITAYAVDQLGDITLVNLDVAAGDTLEAGKAFGTVESVKTLSDLYAPVSGRVVSINTTLETNPEWINEDPYGKGWILEIEITDATSPQLMSPAAYGELISRG